MTDLTAKELCGGRPDDLRTLGTRTQGDMDDRPAAGLQLAARRGVAFVAGVARTHRLWIVRFLAGVYTEVFRGTSALVMIFWVFFVLPIAFGWQLVPMWAGTLALGLTYGAYGSEIVRGALKAVDPAQQEGGIALSFTPWQRMRLILLPQAVPEMIPPFSNLLIELLKGTALVSVMGMGDLAFSGNLVRLALQESAEIYTYLLVIYFVIAFLLTRVMRGLEKKLKAGVGKEPERGVSAHELKRAQTTGVGGGVGGASMKWDWDAVSDFMPYFWDGLVVTLQALVLGSLISFVARPGVGAADARAVALGALAGRRGHGVHPQHPAAGAAVLPLLRAARVGRDPLGADHRCDRRSGCTTRRTRCRSTGPASRPCRPASGRRRPR